jgi:hypothetical protein
MQRAVNSCSIAIQLYWYMTVEKSVGGQHGKLYTDCMARLLAELQCAGLEFEGKSK